MPLCVVPFDRLSRAQLGFPVAFEVAGHQPVFGLDGIILPLGPLGLKAGALEAQLPLGIQPSPLPREVGEGLHREGKLVRFEGLQDKPFDQRIDVRSVHLLTAWLPQLNGVGIADIAGPFTPRPAIAHPQPGPAPSAQGNALQEGVP